MGPTNCPRCGKIFAKRSSSLCDPCTKEEEIIYERVREYVKENPNMPINTVAEECEVSVKRIMSYIRDGKLEASSGMAGEITCSQCGKPIITGRMCEKCILETNFKLSDMKAQAAIKNRGKVFTMNKK